MNFLPLRSSVRFRRPRLRLAAAISAVALFVSGCVSEPSAITGQRQSFGYSWEQERQLGAEADQEITQEMGLYKSPQIQAYVEAVGQRVLQESELRAPGTPDLYRGTPFAFRVLDSPVVNAFALPGGYVYVTRGLLTHVQNEAQLAVVLGHEIAHVAARHSSQQARRAQIGQIGLIAGAILGQTVLEGQSADMAANLLQLGGQGFQLFLLRYSREAEHESDSLGVGWATRAGYAGAESSHFFQALQRISTSEGRSLPTWQSTHPDPGDRAQRVQQIAAENAAPAATPIVGEEEYLRRIEGIVVGDDPREGFVRNGVFHHPALRFQFPVVPGWKVQNEKALVALLDPNGRAILGFRIAPGTNAAQAAATFVREAQVQVVNSGATQYNGLPAAVVIGQANTRQGAIGVWNAFIELDGRVYSFLGYSPAAVFGQTLGTFESVASGFGPLRDSSLLDVKPARLRIVRAERRAPFSSFVPASLPGDMTAETLAIMNQVQLGETIAEGRWLKLPDRTMAGPPPAAASSPVPIANPARTTATPPAPAAAPVYPANSVVPAAPAPPAESSRQTR